MFKDRIFTFLVICGILAALDEGTFEFFGGAISWLTGVFFITFDSEIAVGAVPVYGEVAFSTSAFEIALVIFDALFVLERSLAFGAVDFVFAVG